MYWLYWLSLNGVTSGLTPYLFNRVILSLFLFSGLLWAYSLSSLSGVLLWSSLWFTLCRILWPILSPAYPLLSLFPPFPLVYRRYRYAIRLTRNGDYFV